MTLGESLSCHSKYLKSVDYMLSPLCNGIDVQRIERALQAFGRVILGQ